MSIDFDWLGKEVLNRDLSEDERNMLSATINSETFTEGETIVSQGQPGGTLYILRSGKAKVEIDANGDRVYIAEAGDGSLFGEMTFLTNEAASAYVTAKEDCIVYTITRDAFSQLMAAHHGIVYALTAYMLVYNSRLVRDMNEKHVLMMNYVTGRRH